MAKYQLTADQKDILRAAAKGLQDGTVERQWNIYTHGGEWLGEGVVGFPGAIEMGLTLTDLRDFEEFGFLRLLNHNGGIYVYEVREQMILDAADSDFEIPDVDAAQTSIQTNFFAPLYASNVTIAELIDNITQNVNGIPDLEEDKKAEIDSLVSTIGEALIPFQETHPDEVRDATRSIDLVLGDLSEQAVDKENLKGALARLRRAGEKVVFTTIAHVSMNKLADLIESLQGMGN